MLKVILIDSNILFREGLSNLLQREPEITVVAEASLIHEAVEMVKQTAPDLALVDADLPDIDGCSGIRRLHELLPHMQIVLLSTRECEDELIDAIMNGARGYMPKNSTLNKFMASIHAIQRGEVIIPRGMVGRLLDELANMHQTIRQGNAGLLTARELDVLAELGHGRSNREIAEFLDIAENTVKVHVHNILEKLDLRNRRQAARYASLQGITHSTHPYPRPENGHSASEAASLHIEHSPVCSRL